MMGSTMRSANRNETTPPKLMPPFHSWAASGAFPTDRRRQYGLAERARPLVRVIDDDLGRSDCGVSLIEREPIAGMR